MNYVLRLFAGASVGVLLGAYFGAGDWQIMEPYQRVAGSASIAILATIALAPWSES